MLLESLYVSLVSFGFHGTLLLISISGKKESQKIKIKTELIITAITCVFDFLLLLAINYSIK